MKKQSAGAKPKKQVDWDAVSERVRQQCNKLTEEERKELLEAGLRIIYGADAKAPTRRR